ncbi:hypothetical protein RhiirB3_456841 [Rhizophagus irregularis]|nr:hypothetical protein RhiirB3_456841 [Rhizophagus irregularis]
MHAPSNKDLQQPPNVPPDMDITGAPDGNHTPDPVVTLAITRDDFQVAAAPNAAPESLKKFPTNKALIEAVNNLFLETYESFTGKARMTGSETMDAAMEQTVSFQGKVLFWSSPDNTNKLCHRCGKLGCAPNFCPLKQTRGRTRTCDSVAKLKERFNVNQPPRRSIPNAANSRSCSRSRSKSRDRSASASRHDINNSQDHNNNINNNNIPNPNTSRRARHNSKE